LTDTSERSVHRAYQLDSKDVLKDLGTSEQGLSSPEVEKRLAEHGPNRLEEEAVITSAFWMFCSRQRS